MVFRKKTFLWKTIFCYKPYIYFEVKNGHNDILQGANCKSFFSTGFVIAGGFGFFPIASINLLSLNRIRDSDFKNNFVIIKKINTFKIVLQRNLS